MTTFNTLMTAILINTTGKVMTALGVGFISYTGIDYMHGKFLAWIQSQINSFPADAYQLFQLSGAPDALNWIFSAYAFAATTKAGSKLTARLKT